MKHYYVNCAWVSFLGFTIGGNDLCTETHNFPEGFREKLVGLTYLQIDNIFKTKLPHYKIGGEAILL